MIYCVEDEKNIRELLIYTLETTGFSAKGMANAKELRTALKEELPDLILPVNLMLAYGQAQITVSQFFVIFLFGAAAKNRFYPRHKLHHPERLRDVVIFTGLQTFYLVVLGFLRCDHDHRDSSGIS